MNLINTLIYGDCFNILPLIPDHSVDLILTDPPYNILDNFQWDQNPINLEILWKEFTRILTETGIIAVFSAEPFTSRLILSNLSMFQYKWVWKKVRGTNFMQSHRRPQNNYEEIVIFCNSKNSIYNPQMQERKSMSGQKRILLSKKRAKENKFEYRTRSSDVSAKFSKPMLSGVDKLDPKLKYPTMVIDDISMLNASDSERTEHPTQKPIALYEYFIKTYTNKNMNVLDCFAGSNTIAVSCLNLKRNWIAVESDIKYVEMGLKRLREYFSHGITIRSQKESYGIIYSFMKPIEAIIQRIQQKKK